MIRLVRMAARLAGLSSTSRASRQAQGQLSLAFGPSLGLVAGSPVRGRSPAAARRRSFWMSQDPHDCRRAVIGGSFAEVCAALDRMAAQEACR